MVSMKEHYSKALGVKVIIKEENVDVTKYHKDPQPANSWLKIKCKYGETLQVQPMALYSQEKVCERCKRHYIEIYP